jgi:hypothetical protein
VKVPLARRLAKSHSIIDKLCEYVLFLQSLKTEQQGSPHRMQTRTPPPGFLPICSGPQRRHSRLRAVLGAALPLEHQDFRGEAGLDS